MDPKKIAEEIVKDLFNTYELNEEKKSSKSSRSSSGESGESGEESGASSSGESGASSASSSSGESGQSSVSGESGESGESGHESGEEHEETHAKHAVGQAMKGSAVTAAAASISLKGQLPVAAKSNEVVHDALGGGVHDAHGKGDQITTPTATNAAANAATLNMKPSFSSPQVPQMTNEQLSADISAIFGSQDLSEEFVKNAASIYEAAVIAKVETITEALVEQFEEQLVEQVETVKGALVEQLDNYLSYVVQEWAKENAVAIENGLRTEIAEDFINGLKNLFVESYVEVPQDKVDMFEELSSAVDTLEGRINEEIEKNVELHKEIGLLTAQKVFAEETRGLTVLQAEKARQIAENLEYSDEDDFRNKVKTLVEGLVSRVAVAPKTSKNVNEQIALLEQASEEEPEEETLSPLMEIYAKTINRTLNS